MFIYKNVAFGFLTKNIASHQAVHESSVLTYFFYAHITAWNARDLVLGALPAALEHQDLELWRYNVKMCMLVVLKHLLKLEG